MVEPSMKMRRGCRGFRLIRSVGALTAWLITGVASSGYAVESGSPIYDWERTGYEREYKKPPAAARPPITQTPSLSDQESWKNRQRQTKSSVGVEAVKTAPVAKPSDSRSGVPEATAVSGPVVAGRVVYHGQVPPPAQVKVNRDAEICGAVATFAPLSVDPATGGVRSAVVHIGVNGLEMEELPSQVSVVENKRCLFYPRVAAVRLGTQAEILNSDPIMHNTNMAIANRTVMNVALVAGGEPIRKPMKKEGLHLIKCNVHKFMQAYRFVFGDSFFDQTKDAGQFRIAGLPPGLHTISVWHETLGTLQKEVQVPARGTVTVDFEYPAGAIQDKY